MKRSKNNKFRGSAPGDFSDEIDGFFYSYQTDISDNQYVTWLVLRRYSILRTTMKKD